MHKYTRKRAGGSTAHQVRRPRVGSGQMAAILGFIAGSLDVLLALDHLAESPLMKIGQ